MINESVVVVVAGGLGFPSPSQQCDEDVESVAARISIAAA
jgi:hypothetical protein